MANASERILLTTPKGLARFPALNTPDTKFKKEGRFKVALILDPSESSVEAFASKVNGQIDAFFDETKARLTKEKKGALAKELSIDYPVRPEIDKETGDETGMLVINASSIASGVTKDGKPWKRKLPLFDRLKKPVKVNIGGGSELKLSVSFEPFLNQATKKVTGSFRLEAVQVLKAVQYGGKSADQFGFGEEDGDDIYDYDEDASTDTDDSGDSSDNDDL